LAPEDSVTWPIQPPNWLPSHKGQLKKQELLEIQRMGEKKGHLEGPWCSHLAGLDGDGKGEGLEEEEEEFPQKNQPSCE